ncbi:hypothetical protein [Halochromatium glycolicum]|uniref:Uncharacterized protein n=1 Tax=Halochromatium glycolicum TaxID=85075 RepID=A0AAJ0U376_9GAMM|nr:hypothetical protein [Halochromatium glycolicum]MBK1704005.1 hypothetical protein [Halochromatium glycolicum]
MARPLLALIAVYLPTALIPLAGAVASGQPVGDLLRFPLQARGFDAAPADWAFTLSVYGLSLLALIALVWLSRPRQPGAGSADRPMQQDRWPRFVWLAPLCLLAMIIAIDGGAGNAAVGLFTLALLLVVNADTERRTGSSLLSQRRGYFLLLFPLSLTAGWLFFYWLNLFVGLWRYPNAEEAVPFALGKSLDYATLLPALLSLRQWLASFPSLIAATNRGLRIASDPSTAAPADGWLLIGLAGIGLSAYPVWPDGLYWLMIAAPVLLALGTQILRGQSTGLAGIQRGDWSRPLLSALAALLIIALTQLLNLLLGKVWVYALPLLGGPMLLQLPLPVWLLAPLPLALLGLWLADQLAAPFRQRPQQPPFRPGSPLKVPVVDLSRDLSRNRNRR